MIMRMVYEKSNVGGDVQTNLIISYVVSVVVQNKAYEQEISLDNWNAIRSQSSHAPMSLMYSQQDDPFNLIKRIG
jgi:hypothetical protein